MPLCFHFIKLFCSSHLKICFRDNSFNFHVGSLSECRPHVSTHKMNVVYTIGQNCWQINKHICCAVKKKYVFSLSLWVECSKAYPSDPESQGCCHLQPCESIVAVHLIYDNDCMLDYVLLIKDPTTLEVKTFKLAESNTPRSPNSPMQWIFSEKYSCSSAEQSLVQIIFVYRVYRIFIFYNNYWHKYDYCCLVLCLP